MRSLRQDYRSTARRRRHMSCHEFLQQLRGPRVSFGIIPNCVIRETPSFPTRRLILGLAKIGIGPQIAPITIVGKNRTKVVVLSNHLARMIPRRVDDLKITVFQKTGHRIFSLTSSKSVSPALMRCSGWGMAIRLSSVIGQIRRR